MVDRGMSVGVTVGILGASGRILRGRGFRKSGCPSALAQAGVAAAAPGGPSRQGIRGARLGYTAAR